MATKKRVSVVVDIQGQAQSLQKVIEQAQKSLGDLHLNPKIYQDMQRATKRMIQDLQKVSLAGSQGLQSDTQIGNQKKTLAKISNDFSNMISQIKGLGIKVEDIFPETEEFQKLFKEQQAAFEAHQKKLKQIREKNSEGVINKTEERFKKAAKVGDVEGVKKVERSELVKLSKKEDVSKARNTINELAKTLGISFEKAMDQVEAEVREYNKRTTSQGKASFTKDINKADSQGRKRNFQAEIDAVKDYRQYETDRTSIKKASADYQAEANQVLQLQNNYDKLNQEMQELAGPTQQKVQQAMNEIYSAEGKVEQGAREMGNAFDKAGSDFHELSARENSFNQLKSYFGQMLSATSILMRLGRVARNAVKDFQNLDKQFNEISIVTGKSMQELWDNFSSLNRIAQEYGVTTSNVVSVQKLYYQQGRSAAEVTQLTTETLKFAKISGLEFADATDKMTAAINAYKIGAKDANVITDVYSALSAKAAVDSEELAVAMSKVASLASLSGSTFEDTSAYLTKIIETTREAPETAGTALKTVIARFTEVKKLTADQKELLDEDYNFSNIEKALKTVGVQTKDSTGQMRGFTEILNDLGPIWDNLTTNQQHYIATAAAGARQQSRFIALMDDWKRTTELIDVAQNSEGTGARQFELSLDSIETKLNKLKATWQSFYSNFLDTDLIKGAIELLNELLKVLETIADIPMIGPILVIGIVAALYSIVKKAITGGENFAKGFLAGWDSVMKPAEATRHTKEVADAYKKGVEIGEAKEQGIIDGQNSKKVVGEAVETGADIATEAGGEIVGDVAGNAVGGAALGKTISSAGKGAKGTGAAIGGKLAGWGQAILNGLKAFFSSSAGYVTIAAIVVYVLDKVIDGVINWAAEKAAKKVETAARDIEDTLSSTKELSESYKEANEIQKKGLLATEEEAQKLQETLKAIKQEYPSLIETAADGTLALVQNHEEAYEVILEKQREAIRKNQEIINSNRAAALTMGITGTEAATQAKDDIKNIASNLKEKTDDVLHSTYGVKGTVAASSLDVLAEEGLTLDSFNKMTKRFIGADINTDEFKAMMDAIVSNTSDGKTDYDAVKDKISGVMGPGKLNEAISIFKALDEQAGYNVVATQLEGMLEDNLQKGHAITWANQFANETSSEVSAALKKGFQEAYLQYGSEQGELLIHDYYYNLSKTQREELENYLESYVKDSKVVDDTTKESLLAMMGLPSGSAFGDIIDPSLKKLQEERDKIINDSLNRLNEATGQTFENEDFSDYTTAQLQAFSREIAKVGSKYGTDAGKAFMEAYKTFSDQLIIDSELQSKFLALDLEDVQATSAYAAELAVAFGGASDQYNDFISLVNSSSNILDRNFASFSQLITNVKTDIEKLKETMETLGDSLEGELSIEDALSLVEEYPNLVKFEDFQSTPEGFLLSEEKIAELRKQSLQLKIAEYEIQLAMYKLQGEALKKEAEQKANVDLERYLELQNKLTQKQTLTASELKEYEEMRNDLIEKGASGTAQQYVENQKIVQTLPGIIDFLGKINLDTDAILSKTKRIISALQKGIELLKKIEEYSDIDAYLKDLQLDSAHYDFVIEFSSNVDDVAAAIQDKMINLGNQIGATTTKQIRAEENTNLRRKSLETNFGKYLSFDENGNVLMNDAEIAAWAQNIENLYKQSGDAAKEEAEAQEDIYNSMFDQIEAYRTEKDLAKEMRNETEKTVQEMEKLTNDLRKNVTTLEDKFFDLFVKRDEAALESLEKRYEAAKELDNEYLESVREAVEKERELRDQSKDYEDLAKKEKKLQLLMMSGGSQVEIQKLQEDIADSRQQLNDKEVDNILDSIEESNTARAAAMDEEVEYEQMVLEEKKKNRILYNQEIETLMKQDKETIIATWKTLDDKFLTSTETNKKLLESEMDQMVISAKGAQQALTDPNGYVTIIEGAYTKVKSEISNSTTAVQTFVNTISNTTNGAVNNIGKIYSAYLNIGGENGILDKILDKQAQVIANQKTIDGGSNVPPIKTEGAQRIQDIERDELLKEKIYSKKTNATSLKDKEGYYFSDSPNQKKAWYDPIYNRYMFQVKTPSGEFKAVKFSEAKQIFPATTSGLTAEQLYNKLINPYGPFAQGGLVDFTGPAWVDGTKTKPEAFLSANDTALIAQLTDVLSLRAVSLKPSQLTPNNGDTYYEIYINVDELGDGYSVDDLMDELEERIIQATGNSSAIKIKR